MARTPTMILVALEVSKLRQVSTVPGPTRRPHRNVCVSLFNFHAPTCIIKKEEEKMDQQRIT